MKTLILAITGFKDLIELGIEEKEEGEFVREVSDAVKKLSALLSFYTVDLREKISIQKVINEVTNITNKEIRYDGIDVQIKTIFCFILLNLVKNSIRHSGLPLNLLEIIMTLYRKRSRYEITVRDNGRGVSKKDQKIIFRKKGHALNIIKQLEKFFDYKINHLGKAGFKITFKN